MTEAPTEKWYVISMELTDTYLLINSQQPYDNDHSNYKCKQYMNSSNLIYDEKRLLQVRKMIIGIESFSFDKKFFISPKKDSYFTNHLNAESSVI